MIGSPERQPASVWPLADQESVYGFWRRAFIVEQILEPGLLDNVAPTLDKFYRCFQIHKFLVVRLTRCESRQAG